jgi:hypothetical protein
MAREAYGKSKVLTDDKEGPSGDPGQQCQVSQCRRRNKPLSTSFDMALTAASGTSTTRDCS